ncbi:MAG: glutamine amidotransferase-related protein [Bryobacteraceae bacterium]
MVIFLDIEHPKALDDPRYREERGRTMEQRRALFEELSGEACVTRHFTDFRKEELAQPEVSALVTSGNRSLWEDYDLPSDFSEFQKAIAETQKPVLGICGGHQLIGMLLGGEASPLRQLRDGEADVYPEYAPGWLKEWGYYPIEFDASDPLFTGFREPIVVTERHFWEISRLPDPLKEIAHNPNCAVQAFRHREKPLYGVQFHPEFHDPEHLDGRKLLRNFFRLTDKQS